MRWLRSWLKLPWRKKSGDPIDPDRLVEETRDYSQDLHDQMGKLVTDLDEAFARHHKALDQVESWMGDATLGRVSEKTKDGAETSRRHLRRAVACIEQATREIQEATYDRHLQSGYRVFPIHQDERVDRRADVVFVHGLDGHAFTTWCPDDRRRDKSWPYWLAEKHSDIGVWSLGYDAHKSRWQGRALALPIIAQSVINALNNVGIGRRPLIFVVHSLGGLVVKRAMKDAWDNHRFPGHEGHRALREALRAIVFLATPHDGATIAKLVKSLGPGFRPTAILESLRADDPETLRLGDWFRNEADRMLKAKELEILVYRETEKFKGLLVVNAASANPGIPGVLPRDVPGKNHSTICKCEWTGDMIYKDLMALVTRVINPAPPPTASS